MPPVVSTAELKGQAVAYASIMRLASPNTIIRHMAAVAAAKASGDFKPPSAMTMLWRHVSGNTVLNSQILAFVKLAKIATVMVTGGVENERDNSNLALIKSARRNSLGEVNLNICMRLYTAACVHVRQQGQLHAAELPIRSGLQGLEGGARAARPGDDLRHAALAWQRVW